MNLKKSLLIAITLLLISITIWELYWRNQGKVPTLNDEKSLWSKQRAKVNNATNKDVVLFGSSRIYFDIQLKKWNEITGTNAIQLASTGSSPLPTFHDLVENTNFNGTVIVGVTPGLFFSTTYPKAMPWQRPKAKVDYYKNRTYAQQLNYFFSIPLQQNLVLMSADDEEWADDIDLKSLIRRIPKDNRNGKLKPPPFYNFGKVTLDRNMSMIIKASTDTAFANTIKKIWQYFGKAAPPPDKKSTMDFFLKDAKKFKERGGNLILLRCPSSGFYKEVEAKFLPRKEYWNELVKQSGAIGYHYNDYEQLNHFECPEWSHLSEKDAILFTEEFAKIILNEKSLTNQKPSYHAI
jgi:hypothetical protein